MDDIDRAAIIIDQETERLVNGARRNLGYGDSLEFCEDCEEPIPEKRRRAVPGCRRCLTCQLEFEEETCRLR